MGAAPAGPEIGELLGIDLGGRPVIGSMPDWGFPEGDHLADVSPPPRGSR
ncbi:MAG: hypothetical protein R2701_13490 [Acidimicrobiales bacterium]